MEKKEQERFLAWMRAKVAASGRGIQSRLAEALGVNRSAINNMLSGKRADITVSEREAIYNYFRQNPPDADLSSPTKTGGVIVMGRVGIWENKDDTSAHAEVVPSPSPDYSADEQLAYRIARSSSDGEFIENDYVFTIPHTSARKIKAGDEVVTKVVRGDLVCYTLKRAIKRGGKIQFVPIIDTKSTSDDEQEIVGIVIGVFQRRPRK
jgi:transcriptional regulator with XRE-family HTH domain